MNQSINFFLIKKFSRLLLLFPLLFLFSCEKSSWEYNYVSNNKNNNFSTLVYKKQGCFELEFLNLNGKIICYVNLRDFKIKKPSPVPINIISNGSVKKSFAVLREGSKRLCLDEEDKDIIIGSLEKSLPLSIEIEDYHEDIDPQFFPKNYKKFLETDSLSKKVISFF